MTTNHVKISLPSGGTPVVEVEGHDLAQVVASLSFDASPGPYNNRLRLNFVPAEVLIEGELQVVINEELYDALMALGWTDPDGMKRIARIEGEHGPELPTATEQLHALLNPMIQAELATKPQQFQRPPADTRTRFWRWFDDHATTGQQLAIIVGSAALVVATLVAIMIAYPEWTA